MKQNNAGVTLVELMVTVAIVGILAAIAYPSYQRYVQRASRTDAKARLMEVSQDLQKCFTRYMSYTNASCAIYNDVSDADGVPTEKRRYVITIQAPTARTYTLTATPQGAQALDADCMNLTLTESGVRGRSGTGDPQTCW
jgi:type IV pilus assembly protein PilE